MFCCEWPVSLPPFAACSAGRDDAKSDDWCAEPSECNKNRLQYNTELVYTFQYELLRIKVPSERFL